MKLPEDFKEFIELLNVHRVKYLIVGGYAVGFHSRPKFTQDLDIWIAPTEENAQRLLRVLQDFGFGELEITTADLTNPDRIIQLGYVPLRIDILTSLTGIDFSKAYHARVEGSYLGVKAYFISLDDILENKRQSGRKKDLEDIEWIKKYTKR